MRPETKLWRFFGIKSPCNHHCPVWKATALNFIPTLPTSFPIFTKFTQASKLQSISHLFYSIILTWSFCRVWVCRLIFTPLCQQVASSLEPARNNSKNQLWAVSTFLWWNLLCFSAHVMRIMTLAISVAINIWLWSYSGNTQWTQSSCVFQVLSHQLLSLSNSFHFSGPKFP